MQLNFCKEKVRKNVQVIVRADFSRIGKSAKSLKHYTYNHTFSIHHKTMTKVVNIKNVCCN